MVERANKEVFRHLIPMINDKKCKDNFVPLLPFAQRIMNTIYNYNGTLVTHTYMYTSSVHCSVLILIDPAPFSNNGHISTTMYIDFLIRV